MLKSRKILRDITVNRVQEFLFFEPFFSTGAEYPRNASFRVFFWDAIVDEVNSSHERPLLIFWAAERRWYRLPRQPERSAWTRVACVPIYKISRGLRATPRLLLVVLKELLVTLGGLSDRMIVG